MHLSEMARIPGLLRAYFLDPLLQSVLVHVLDTMPQGTFSRLLRFRRNARHPLALRAMHVGSKLCEVPSWGSDCR
jgi:hypothetical protein